MREDVIQGMDKNATHAIQDMNKNATLKSPYINKGIRFNSLSVLHMMTTSLTKLTKVSFVALEFII